jgi:hypothetical protein
MKKNRLSFLLSLIVTCSAWLSASSAQSTTEAGFTSLFNGKDFTGWDLKIRSGDQAMAQRVFTAADGVVHVFKDFPDGYELNTGKGATHGLIYTKKSYSRYIFRFEYKWGAKRMNNFGQFQYDAGMYYHVYNDAIWPKGVEYQIRFNHLTGNNHTGDFWASGTAFQWYAGDDGQFQLPGQGGRLVSRKSGEHRSLKAAPFHALDGQWNQCEVIVMGDHYAIHKLNGVIVNLATGLSVKEGIIGLQSETAEIFYRNIMIKEFTEDQPIERFLPIPAAR